MPYVSSQGFRIHYQVEGDGPPLVLLHGSASTIESWYQLGYVDGLKSHFRLILLDLRGRGESDKPHDPEAYALSCYVADVIAVLDALHIPQALILGISLGGWITFGMAKYAPERVLALVIGATHPYETPESPFGPGKVDGTDPEAFIATLEAFVGLSAPFPAEKRAQLLSYDLVALAAALAMKRTSLADVLPTMTMPCLLYVGEEDPRFSKVQECATDMPNVTFKSLPGLDHFRTLERSDLVLPHVTTFLNAVSQVV